MNDCTFNEELHRYEIGGRFVPSVTQVLGDLLPCFQAGDWYLERGRAVHACAAMIAKGIDFEHDEQIDGQVLALRRFFREVNPIVVSVEKQVFSKRYLFAGTLDLLSNTVIDFKTSISESVPYQLAAYAIAEEEMTGNKIAYGFAVQINDDGTYSMSKSYDLKRYKQGFLAMLTTFNIRRQAGIKEGK